MDHGRRLRWCSSAHWCPCWQLRRGPRRGQRETPRPRRSLRIARWSVTALNASARCRRPGDSKTRRRATSALRWKIACVVYAPRRGRPTTDCVRRKSNSTMPSAGKRRRSACGPSRTSKRPFRLRPSVPRHRFASQQLIRTLPRRSATQKRTNARSNKTAAPKLRRLSRPHVQPPMRTARPSRVPNMNKRSRLRRSVARGLKNPEPMPWLKTASLPHPCRRLPHPRRCVELGKPARGQAIRTSGRSQALLPTRKQVGVVSPLPDEIPALPLLPAGRAGETSGPAQV